MQRVFCIILLLCAHGGCFAQQTFDTSRVTVRNFNAGKIQGYTSDPAFKYETANEAPVSSWDRFWIWVWYKVNELMSKPATARTLKVISITAASALLVYFLIRLSGMNNSGLFGKKNTGDSLQYVTRDEDIYSINFNQALQQAINSRNFRLAIRLLYLQSLKNLADRMLIQWQINKTNSAYVSELKDELQQKDFHRLTMQFENNWYGNMPVHEHEFAAVREQFEQFNRQLK